MRCNDVPYNPTFFAHALIDLEARQIKLFVDKLKFKTEEVKSYLWNTDIELYDYEQIENHVGNFKSYYKNKELVVNKETTNSRLVRLAIEKQHTVVENNLVKATKYIKDKLSIHNFRIANKKDCRALIRFFAWLEKEVNTAETTITEWQAAVKCSEFRMEEENFFSESFYVISAYGKNAAMPHYLPKKENSPAIGNTEPYLCDSGAQYLEGTTDITRTLFFGKNPFPKYKSAYTRVLLGNLMLTRQLFKNDGQMTGSRLDNIARGFLGQANMSFGHGTGHGVGMFLNCHEGPTGIRPGNDVPVEEGYLTSNEPGYYKDDEFGIRIEDVIYCVSKGRDMLGFENLTLLPYETRLLDTSLLSKDFVNYINDYHEHVRTFHAPSLEDDEVALAWLEERTKAILIE